MSIAYSTKRLILKTEFERSWSKILSFYIQNKKRFEPYEPTRSSDFYTAAYQLSYLSFEHRQTKNHNLLRLWLYTKENPEQILGTICFSNICYGALQSASLGYKLDFSAVGQGYCTEACQKGLEIMQNEYGLHRIEARILPSNSPSKAVLNRLHFHYEGLERKSVEINHQWEDHLRYSFLLDKDFSKANLQSSNQKILF